MYLYINTKISIEFFAKLVALPLDFFAKRGMLIGTIPSEKEAIRMLKWFQELVNARYQELSQLSRGLHGEANK